MNQKKLARATFIVAIIMALFLGAFLYMVISETLDLGICDSACIYREMLENNNK